MRSAPPHGEHDACRFQQAVNSLFRYEETDATIFGTRIVHAPNPALDLLSIISVSYNIMQSDTRARSELQRASLGRD
jgi:hypothetical protein